MSKEALQRAATTILDSMTKHFPADKKKELVGIIIQKVYEAIDINGAIGHSIDQVLDEAFNRKLESLGLDRVFIAAIKTEFGGRLALIQGKIVTQSQSSATTTRRTHQYGPAPSQVGLQESPDSGSPREQESPRSAPASTTVSPREFASPDLSQHSSSRIQVRAVTKLSAPQSSSGPQQSHYRPLTPQELSLLTGNPVLNSEYVELGTVDLTRAQSPTDRPLPEIIHQESSPQLTVQYETLPPHSSVSASGSPSPLDQYTSAHAGAYEPYNQENPDTTSRKSPFRIVKR